MILLIDNYDSFVYNLARYVGMLGRPRRVVRNDTITIQEVLSSPPDAIIISPGPCSPAEAGISNTIVRMCGAHIPILGVCLGHQCIGEMYGGRTIRAHEPVHGKTSMISHTAEGIFMGLPNPLRVARYHSLICEIAANAALQVTAETEDGIIMAVQHKTYPVYGVQFHPESILTEQGLDIVRNFLLLADGWNEKDKLAAA